MYSRIASVIVALLVVISPLPALAEQSPQVQALIRALLAQVAVLQEQLRILQTQQGITPSCTITRTLSKGATGEDVKCLQNFLIARGHLEAGNNTGYFGALTEAAVQKYQTTQGIVSSGTPATTGYGLVGTRTRAAIAQTNTGTPSTPAQPSGGGSVISVGGGGGRGSSGGSGGNPSSANCTFNNQTVADGASVVAYQTASVPTGQTCALQERKCTNGILSGSYAFESCATNQANTVEAARAELVALRKEVNELKSELRSLLPTAALKTDVAALNAKFIALKQEINYSSASGPFLLPFTANGCSLLIQKTGMSRKAGCFGALTTPAGNTQFFIEGYVLGSTITHPAIVIGGDRQPADVQFPATGNPAYVPKNRPTHHVMIGHSADPGPSGGGTGEGTYGDAYVASTVTVAPRKVAFDTAGNFAFPKGEPGTILLGGTMAGSENGTSLARLYFQGTTGLLQGTGWGISGSGNPAVGPLSAFGALEFRFSPNSSFQMAFTRPLDNKEVRIGFDNSGVLRYVPLTGTPVQIGNQ